MPVVSIAESPDLRGLTVLVRSSLNVPQSKGVVTDPFRIMRALETLTHLRYRGARIIVLSHLGRSTDSLSPVHQFLSRSLAIRFVHDTVGPEARQESKRLKDGELLLLENVRRNAGEVENDEQFARELASLADVFVNDDFAASHRAHASIVGVPRFLPSYAGLQFTAELRGLAPALQPQSPSIVIVGGAKFLTKEPLIRALVSRFDHVFVGGALANDLLKLSGKEVGRSLVSGTSLGAALLKNSKVLIPNDVTVDGSQGRRVVGVDEVHTQEIIYDAGPETLQMLAPFIAKARTIVWNGPLGNFEKGYREVTESLARSIAGAPGVSIVGGGDTIAAIESLKLNTEFDFVSTAGGAMLEYVAHGSLAGIRALEEARQLG